MVQTTLNICVFLCVSYTFLTALPSHHQRLFNHLCLESLKGCFRYYLCHPLDNNWKTEGYINLENLFEFYLQNAEYWY
jgi:hypothetical protein